MKIAATCVALLCTMLFAGGCAYNEPYAVYDRPVYAQPAPVYAEPVEYGVVESIDLYRYGQSAPTGLGAIIGGVAGGVLGHQIGSGRGNTAATIAGAVGGAVVGNEVERSNARDRYAITVRLDNGALVRVSSVGEGQLRVGDRVRVVDGRVYRV
ncbi:MAG TPA: glycine zipper 2TM domain-containing protein [Casimicrobiaceae bacterium]|nr:glycine zipper 2TM domain-containing protein [Casimicrobiaceae bacterium]